MYLYTVNLMKLYNRNMIMVPNDIFERCVGKRTCAIPKYIHSDDTLRNYQCKYTVLNC